MWDEFVNSRFSSIADGSTGNDACNSYYMIEEDVKMLKELRVNYF